MTTLSAVIPAKAVIHAFKIKLNMDIREFLIRAKKATYAGGGEGAEKKLDNGGRELIYRDGDWEYRDIYFGYDPFVGEEIVWQKEKAVWAMNYYGKTVSADVPAEKIYGFLKKALLKVEIDSPFRGGASFKSGDLSYVNENNGSLNEFQGLETVFYKDKKVYELHYQGGAIKSKI